jgi:WhiB family transcriptional regulator, redox-sensing transcriptional regulator
VRWEGAECADAPPDLFFPTPKRRGMEPDYGPALEVCRSCELVVECRSYATRERIADGVWGRTTPEQREAERKARRVA